MESTLSLVFLSVPAYFKRKSQPQSALYEFKAERRAKLLTGRLLGFQEPQESVGLLVGFIVCSQGPGQEPDVGIFVGFFVGFQEADQESVGLLVGIAVSQEPDHTGFLEGLPVGDLVGLSVCIKTVQHN